MSRIATALFTLVVVGASLALTGCPKKPATTPSGPTPTQPMTTEPPAAKGATMPEQKAGPTAPRGMPGKAGVPGVMSGKGGVPGGMPGKAGMTKGGGGRRGMTTDQVFQRFDKNKDGKLTKSEVSASVWQRMSKADTNGDGAVTKDELKKAREKAAAERKAAGGQKAAPGAAGKAGGSSRE